MRGAVQLGVGPAGRGRVLSFVGAHAATFSTAERTRFDKCWFRSSLNGARELGIRASRRSLQNHSPPLLGAARLAPRSLGAAFQAFYAAARRSPALMQTLEGPADRAIVLSRKREQPTQ